MVSEQKKVKWEEMTPAEFLEIVEQRPIVYVPLGLLEWHGDHLPLGTDFMKMYGIVLEIVKRTGGVVMPPTFYGRPGYGSFAGTMVFSEELIYDSTEKRSSTAVRWGDWAKKRCL